MTRTWDIVTVAATLGTGIIGGVFYAFSAFVMPGLSRVRDDHGIATMKSINVTALRPPLMLALFGTAAVCVALIVRAVRTWGDRSAPFLLAGGLLYLVGAVGTTIVYNVPRNNRLATLADTAADASAQWRGFVGEWTVGNHVRTVASLAALVLFTVALLAGTRAE